MEGVSKRKIAISVYFVYCFYCVFMWCIREQVNWTQAGMWISAAGMAGGAFLTFRKKFKPETQAYFIASFATLNILVYSVATHVFTQMFTVLCALACLFSFYHIPRIHYFYYVTTLGFILYHLFAENRIADIIAGEYLIIIRILSIFLIETVLLILVKWHLKALEELQDKAAEAELACQAKSDFLSNMSHEIRTPMNVIMGMTELVMEKDIREEEKEYIYGIHTAGENLLAIINDILDFSKIESGDLEVSRQSYEMMSFFYDIIGIAQIQMGEKKVEFIADINPNIPLKLVGDGVRLKQVILNLISNAIKYTEQGRIKFIVDFTETQQGLDLTVTVNDSGIGIKDEDKKKLFRAFEQIDSKRNRAVQGTGLGLAISKELVTLMGGRLHFTSTYGKGTEFTFTIPQRIADSTPCAAVRDKDQIYFGIYTENEYMREALGNMLKQLEIKYVELEEKETMAEKVVKFDINYLFVDCSQGSDIPKIIAEIPDKTEIIVYEDAYVKTYAAANIHMVKKPIYSIALALVLNHQDMGIAMYEKEIKEVRSRFRAPEAKILVVDDNAVNLKVAEGLLKPYDMQIDTAVSGEEAIEKVLKNAYDLVLMDHMMPKMDGIEATEIIRQQEGEYYQKLPIIALSANAVQGAQEMFLGAGMNDFVPKPIEMRVLADKLLQYLPKDKIIKRTSTETSEVSGIEAFPQIEGLDTKAGFKLVGEDEKLYCEIVKVYAVEVEKRAEEIEENFEQEDWESYIINVHSLKSISGTIGAMEIFQLAKELEEKGKNKDIEVLLQKTPILLEHYRKLGKELLAVIGDKETTKQEEEEKAEPVKEELAKELHLLIQCLEEYDSFGAEEIIDNMKRYHYASEESQDIFHKIQKAMDQFDYEICKEEACRMLTELQEN